MTSATATLARPNSRLVQAILLGMAAASLIASFSLLVAAVVIH